MEKQEDSVSLKAIQTKKDFVLQNTAPKNRFYYSVLIVLTAFNTSLVGVIVVCIILLATKG